MSDNFETTTNLLTEENIALYFWSKVDVLPPFKPIGAKSFSPSLLLGDLISSDILLNHRGLGDDAKKFLNLKKDCFYNVDSIAYKNFDDNNELLNEGELTIIFSDEQKFYAIAYEDKEGKLIPLLKGQQKKRAVLGTYKETITLFEKTTD